MKSLIMFFNIKNYFLNFNKFKKISYIFFSLMVAVASFSGCSTTNKGLENNQVKKWEDYFDSDKFEPINNPNENPQIKQEIKKAMR